MPRERKYRAPKPWPQAPVPGQEGKAPTVVKVPLRNQLEFQRTIGKRIIGSMAFGWFGPLYRSLRRPYPTDLDDATILNLLFHTVFSRFITTELDAADANLFEPFLATRQADEVDFKIDFSAMSRVHTLPGIYVAPTIALGRLAADGSRRFLALRINGLTLTPTDGNAWALARYFLMQGAGLHVVLVHHTPLHFQFDAINAITMSVLPPEHTLLRLLKPHFQFTLSLNQAALHSRLSILTNNQLFAYSTFPGDEASTHHFQATGWSGVEGNRAYPAYRFNRRPPRVFGELGKFLDVYYEEVLRFTRKVVAAIPAADPQVLRWADAVSSWVPGFPNAEQIQAPDALAEVAAYCVWGPTIAHSTEHYGLTEDIPILAIPLRLRVPPPFSRDIPAFNPRSLTRFGDIFRQRVAWEWLVRDHTATHLKDVGYDFSAPELRRANDEFKTGLQETDASLRVHRFVPLKRIARSIQI